MADKEVTVANDPPVPDLADVEQRPLVEYPAVKVEVVGSVRTQSQPARIGYVSLEYLGTAPTRIATADPRRQSVTMVSDTEWFMMNKASGVRAPIPANMPITCMHASEIWAAAAAAETQLTVITEIYAQ